MEHNIQLPTFITSNAAKAKYLSEYFDVPVEHVKLHLHEIQSLDPREIVEDKVKRAYKIVKKPVFVEDVSLIFEGMGTLPGPLIKWFLETLGNEGLCKLVDSLETRNARAEIVYALYDGKEVHMFTGERRGRIAERPRGEKKFGWDPIFIPEGHDRTWAEMSYDEIHATSMRRGALEEMKKFILGEQRGEKVGRS